ncbi:MAG TPA: LytR C-terminal domain-containing protein [Gemmatimonadaceae bacterium]|nr:LytR C-terminal domain-containing protein [Gemmatimonadaceae bacterium]
MELPPLNDPPPSERRGSRRLLPLAMIALVAVVAAIALWSRLGGRRDQQSTAAAPAVRPASGRGLSFRREARAPEGVRIRVEVLNATKTRGLARRATQLLRDRGFDVVDVGTVGASLDTSLVLDRSGHPEWARLVADALGGARVESRPDSSRYLDVTVQVGASWRPPAKPFYP